MTRGKDISYLYLANILFRARSMVVAMVILKDFEGQIVEFIFNRVSTASHVSSEIELKPSSGLYMYTKNFLHDTLRYSLPQD